MSLPTFVALELASDEPGSCPVCVAWSLPDGRIKQALIDPDPDWDSESTTWVSSDLGLEAYSPDEIVRELLYDQQDDAWYATQLHPQEGGWLMLFESANREVTFELVEAQDLYEPGEWQGAYDETLAFLGLDPSRAEDQVRALLEVHVMLTGEMPDLEEGA